MFNLKIQCFPAQLCATFLGKAVLFGFIQCCWILLPTPRSVWSSDDVRWNFWKWMADRNNGCPYDLYIPIYIYICILCSADWMIQVAKSDTFFVGSLILGNLQSFNRCFQMFPRCSVLAPGASRKKRTLWLAKNGSLLEVTQTGSQHPTETAGCLVDDGTTGRCDVI